jgi:hypothetical protein
MKVKILKKNINIGFRLCFKLLKKLKIKGQKYLDKMSLKEKSNRNKKLMMLIMIDG